MFFLAECQQCTVLTKTETNGTHTPVTESLHLSIKRATDLDSNSYLATVQAAATVKQQQGSLSSGVYAFIVIHQTAALIK